LSEENLVSLKVGKTGVIHPICDKRGCEKPATCKVPTVSGMPLFFCEEHKPRGYLLTDDLGSRILSEFMRKEGADVKKICPRASELYVELFQAARDGDNVRVLAARNLLERHRLETAHSE